MASIGYRPEIDGLRAVAVVPVILFHLGLGWLPGGFIGVDVFFVISGFLITSIIKKELDQGTFSFRNFWARRVRRILPALVFVTATTLAVTFVFVFRPEQQPIGKQALATLLSVANIYFWRSTGDYWGPTAEESPFLHAWSLSLEEQFYLFFPIAMWLIVRLRPRGLESCILFAVVASLGVFLWGAVAHPTATFYLLPTRIWELGTGCLLAVTLYDRSESHPKLEIFSLAGLCMVISSYLFVEELGGGLALGVLGAAFIIAFGQHGVCNSLLSQRAVVHIGKISYSLYLWHWPVLVLAVHLGFDSTANLDRALLVGATYLLALGTYRLIERPTRRRSGIVPAILTSGAVVACGAFAMGSVSRRYDTTAYAEARYVTFDCNPDQKFDTVRFATTVVENPDFSPDAFCTEGIRIGNKSVKPQIVVIGDSHGCMWSDAIATAVRKEGLEAAFYCMRGVNPFVELPLPSEDPSDDTDALFHRAKLSFIEAWKPKLIIVGKRWFEEDRLNAKDLLEFAGQQGSKVLLIEDPPVLPCGSVNAMQWLASKNIQPREGERQYVPAQLLAPNEEGRGVVRWLAEKYNHVELLPTYDLFVSESGVLALDDSNVIFLDDNHLLQAGAKLIVPRLRDAISATVPTR